MSLKRVQLLWKCLITYWTRMMTCSSFSLECNVYISSSRKWTKEEGMQNFTIKMNFNGNYTLPHWMRFSCVIILVQFIIFVFFKVLLFLIQTRVNSPNWYSAQLIFVLWNLVTTRNLGPWKLPRYISSFSNKNQGKNIMTGTSKIIPC